MFLGGAHELGERCLSTLHGGRIGFVHRFHGWRIYGGRWRRGGRFVVLVFAGDFQKVLLHVEGQLFRLAGEHFGQFQQIEEQHERQVLTRQALVLLRGRFGTGGALTGCMDGRPVALQRRGQRYDGGARSAARAVTTVCSVWRWISTSSSRQELKMSRPLGRASSSTGEPPP